MRSIISTILLCFVLSVSGQIETRWGDITADTLTLSRMLGDAPARTLTTPEARVAYFGGLFVGRPYGAHTLECDPEMVTVRLDSLDCTTFVETVAALAITLGERRTSWHDFVYNLRRIRYRGGNVDGYASRLHYIADWAVDNKHRGNIEDVTDKSPKYNYETRSIDFMTGHRDRYAALADSATYERIRAVESGYRNHRFPVIKSIDLSSKPVKNFLRNGDIVAFVSKLKDLDVTHMGIIYKETPASEPYVLHASSTDGKVEISKRPLHEFVQRNRAWSGIRVFRLKE